MFLKNSAHLQQNIFGIESHLSDKKRNKLMQSPEAAFYELIYCNINEQDFALLYSDGQGRPNAAVNALISSIILQQKKGWTTEELFDHIDFDLRTRMALGLRTLDETPFCPASYFNFQNRLLQHFCETGVNLMELVFDTLTQEQLAKLKIKTDIQRMDSFQAMSNIRSYSRTQLLIEMLLRLNRVFSVRHQKKVKRLLAPYLKQSSSKYVYGLKRCDIPHELEKLGGIYHTLYQQFKPIYGDREVFVIFERVYFEHFCIVEDAVQVRDAKDIGSGSLQSPDDIDATFRNKRDKNYQGQVVNVTETANPDNDINLVTDVAVAPNNTDDSTVLGDRIDAIKQKCSDIEELHTDGGYGSSDNDKKMQKNAITHVQTAVRGRTADVAMKIEQTAPDQHAVSCPLQSTQSQPTRTRFKACFDDTICASCTIREHCPAIEQKNGRAFYFTDDMVHMQERVRAIEKLPIERRRLRPNIEATVKEYTKAFNHKGKLRVRGAFRTMLFATAMSIAINVGRIYRYLVENPHLKHLLAHYVSAFVCLIVFIRCAASSLRRLLTLKMPKMSKNYVKLADCQVL